MKLRIRLLLASLLLDSVSAHAAPLRIVTEAWPPFIFAEKGEVKGADKEVADHILSRLGYQVSWRLTPWRRALRDVESGEADAILDIGPHQNYLTTFLFTTEPMSSHETMLFHDRRRPFAFRSLSDLAGLVIGVSPGYLYNNDEFISSEAFFREPAPTFEANMQKLVRGRIDMVAMSKPVGLYTSDALGISHQIRYHPMPLSQSDFFLAFTKAAGWAETAAEFSEALKVFKTTEQYQRILEKYRLESLNGTLTLAR